MHMEKDRNSGLRQAFTLPIVHRRQTEISEVAPKGDRRTGWSNVSARKCHVAASTFKEDRELTSPGPLSRASYRLVV